jgi:hypothetical protein
MFSLQPFQIGKVSLERKKRSQGKQIDKDDILFFAVVGIGYILSTHQPIPESQFIVPD